MRFLSLQGVPPVALGCARRYHWRERPHSPRRLSGQICFRIFREGYEMKVNEATVRHVARLARIKVSAEEAKNLERELSGILDWVEQLDEVDTSQVEPMTRMAGMALPRRDDEVTDGGYADDIVKNAPAGEDHFFMVPKVVE